GDRGGRRDDALVRGAAGGQDGVRASPSRRNPRRPRRNACPGGAGRRRSGERKHPRRDRPGRRRIHAGPARAARQRPRAQIAEADRLRRDSRRHDPQTMDSSRSERMKPLSIADYLDHLGRAAGEKAPPRPETSPFRPRSLPGPQNGESGARPLFEGAGKLAEAHVRGREEGLAAGRVEASDRHAAELAALREQAETQRQEFHISEYMEFEGAIRSGLRQIEENVGAAVTRILAPFLSQAVVKRAAEE